MHIVRMQGAVDAVASTCDDSQEQDHLILAKQLRRLNEEGSYVPSDALEELIHQVRFPEPDPCNVALLKEVSSKIDCLLTKLECMTEEAILDNKPTKYLDRCMNAGGELGRQKRKVEKDLRLAESLVKSAEDEEEAEYVEKCREEYRARKARRTQADSEAASSGLHAACGISEDT